MALQQRVVASAGSGAEQSSLTISYDDVPVNVGGGQQGLIAQTVTVRNPSLWGFWVGVRAGDGRTAQYIFDPAGIQGTPVTDQVFNLPTGQAARFYFTQRPDGKLDGLSFESAFVPWTGARQRTDWP